MEAEKEIKKIGIRLKNLRKEAGYSNPDKFAYENNLNRSQYGKYEAGTSNPTIKTLITILNIHNISLSQFFDSTFEEELMTK